MKTLYALALAMTFTAQAWAECPPLADVVPQLDTIRNNLSKGSKDPVQIGKQSYVVHYGETGKAVDDILAGLFEGHSIHRLEETEPGACEYLLTDDNTPARGSFYLKYK